MAKYFIKMELLKSEGEDMISYAKNTIANDVQELINLASKLEWEGPSYNMFVELYTEKMNKIKYLAAMIEAYGNFMVLASEKFSGVNKDFQKEWQKIIDELEEKKNEYYL